MPEKTFTSVFGDELDVVLCDHGVASFSMYHFGTGVRSIMDLSLEETREIGKFLLEITGEERGN